MSNEFHLKTSSPATEKPWLSIARQSYKVGTDSSTNCKEHQRFICLNQPNKFDLAGLNLQTGHDFQFNDTTVVSKTTGFWHHVILEELEI